MLPSATGVGMSSKIIEFDGVVTSVGTTLFGRTFEPLVTVLTGTFAPWERMLMLPVPAGTVKLTTFYDNSGTPIRQSVQLTFAADGTELAFDGRSVLDVAALCAALAP